MKKLILLLSAPLFVWSITSCGPSQEEKDAILQEISAEFTEAVEEAVAEPEEEWKAFTSEGGNFTVDFPGVPQETSQELSEAGMNFTIHMYSVERSLSEALMVGYVEYPVDNLDEFGNSDEILASAKMSAINTISPNMQIDEDEPFMFHDKWTGHRMKAHSPDGIYAHYIVTLRDNKLYQLIKLKENSYSDQADVDRFFNSFKYLDEVEGEPVE